MDAEQIKQWLEGQRQANELLEQERMNRLATMTEAEATAIYRDLVASWEKMEPHQEGLENLAMWRLETKIAVRQALTQIAKAKGWI